MIRPHRPHPGNALGATLIGATAVLMWGTLAPLSAMSGAIPPFEKIAIAFALAFLIGVGAQLARGSNPLHALRQPPGIWLLGVAGLFGFHFFFFLALRSAPPVEANLINYLWPLLILFFSALLPGERLGWRHLAGGLLGLAGTALLVTRGSLVELRLEYLPGYVEALVSAVIWASYSVASRRLAAVPTDAVAGFCLATAVLSALCHGLFEETVWPATPTAALSLVLLGLGPVGAAFFVWDHGVKHGDIRILATLSYASPVLSTLLLIVLGLGESHWTLWLACALVVGGAILGSGGMAVRAKPLD